MRRATWTALAAATMVGCAGAPASAPALRSWDHRLGVAELDSLGSGCLATARRSLVPGASVTLVTVPTTAMSRGAVVVEAAVTGAVRGDCAVDDFPAGDTTYAIGVADSGSHPLRGPYVAVFDEISLHLEGPTARGDVDRDGVLEWFASCTGMEGFHVTVWTGSPRDGRRRFHRYVPLRYDVQPTCTPAELDFGSDRRR